MSLQAKHPGRVHPYGSQSLGAQAESGGCHRALTRGRLYTLSQLAAAHAGRGAQGEASTKSSHSGDKTEQNRPQPS